MQAFIIYLGYTAFRPIEVCRARIDNLLFEDRQHPRIINEITKTGPKHYYDKNGKLLTIKYTKIKRRAIPLWIRDYFEEYIRRNWQTMANGYLFSNGKGTHLSNKNMVVYFDKLRKRMYRDNPIRYSWVMDTVGKKPWHDKKTGITRIVSIHRLSMYSFRKTRTTWYAMACLEKGISDVALCTAQWLGHSGKSIHHTYRYIKRLIADDLDTNITQLKPPNLNENIIGVTNPTNEIDKIVIALSQSHELREAIRTYLEKNKESN
jgi:integrase